MTKVNSLLYPIKKHKRRKHSLKTHNRKKLKLRKTHRQMTLKKKKQKCVFPIKEAKDAENNK